MEYLLFATALFLAFGNGANDNFKGFATVWGSGALSYRQALWLATLATAAGSVLSLYLASGLVAQFSGKGLLPQAIVNAPQFVASVGLGAALTVMLATRVGLPISTTHALIGGLVGAGLAASPGEVEFAKLGSTFLLPLLLSPIAAALLGLAAYRLLRLRNAAQDCACVLPPQLTAAPVMAHGMLPFLGSAMAPALGPVAASPHGPDALTPMVPRLVLAPAGDCAQLPGPVARFSVASMLDKLHIFSASLICFARAVNDTPKLAALLVAAQLLNAQTSLLVIATAMVVGGLLLSRRVAHTMGQRVSSIDTTQGVAANLITATLVLAASQFSLPVSTTHVSVGSIAGVGAIARTLDWEVLRSVLLSWVATLPLAGALSWVAMQVL